MNKTTLNSQKEKHSMLSLRRATSNSKVLVAVIELFLSTLSLRRATAAFSQVVSAKLYFYTGHQQVIIWGNHYDNLSHVTPAGRFSSTVTT